MVILKNDEHGVCQDVSLYSNYSMPRHIIILRSRCPCMPEQFHLLRLRPAVLDLSEGWGVTPSGASRPPSFYRPSTGLVQNTSKIHC